jgi:hypothetical protein
MAVALISAAGVADGTEPEWTYLVSAGLSGVVVIVLTVVDARRLPIGRHRNLD